MAGPLPRWFDLDRRVVRHGLALGLFVAALCLRLLGIGTQPLWFDEGMTTHIVHAEDGLAYVHNTPPLYYWLLRPWTSWFGIGAAGLRSLSALAGAGFVWAAFHGARAAFGNRAALPAALLALLSPIHLYYSQEARAYALLLLLLTVALWMLWRLAERVRIGAFLLLVGASAAALYTHYLAAFLLAPAYAVCAWSPPPGARRTIVRALGAAALAVVLLLLPWLLTWSQSTPFEARDMQWLAVLWAELPGLSAFAHSTELLLLGGQDGHSPIYLKQFTSLPFPDLLRVAGLVAAGLLLALGLWRSRAVPAGRRAMLQCVVLFAGPLVLLWVVSTVHPVYCPGRYDLVALPGLVLLLGGAAGSATAAGRPVKWLARLALLVLAAVFAAKDWSYLTAPSEPDPHRDVAAHLAAHARPDETAVLCGATGVPVLAHLYQQGFTWSDRTCRSARSGASFGLRLLPPSLEQAPGTVARYLRALEEGRLAAELAGLLPAAPARGIWLVVGRDLQSGGRDPAKDAAARQLFAVLHGAGYALADNVPELGIAHLLHRTGR